MLSYHPEPYTPSTFAGVYTHNWRAVEDCIDVHRVARCIKGYVWSPCQWANGYRSKTSFLGARWCVLDFDSGTYTLDKALWHWKGFTHVLGTTKSHQVSKDGRTPCDRFRLAILWERPIVDLALYEDNLRRLQVKLEADAACVDGARFFFPCRDIVSVNPDGFVLSVEPLRKRPKFRTSVLPDPQSMPARALRFMTGRLPIIGTGPDGRPKYNRNVEAFYFANRALDRGWGDDDIFDVINRVFQMVEGNAHTDREVKHIIESARKTFDTKT